MNHTDDIHALAGLLPFYANGQLDAEQRARIDAALVTMPALRAELAEVQSLQARIKASGERAPGPAPAAPAERLRRLQARIAAETPEAAPPPPRLDASTAVASIAPPTQTAGAAPRSRRPRFRPSPGMALAAGLAIVCIVQGAMLYRLRSDSQGETYASLSGTPPPAATGGARFTLRIRANTPWSDIQSLCERLNLHIVGGPDDGMIDVAPADGLDAAQADALETALKRSPSVAFVGRQG